MLRLGLLGLEIEMPYYVTDGIEVTEEQIRVAFEAGKAVIVYGRGENCTTTSLALDGQHRDTRGECYSVWDEVWTAQPQSLKQALDAGRGR